MYVCSRAILHNSSECFFFYLPVSIICFVCIFSFISVYPWMVENTMISLWRWENWSLETVLRETKYFIFKQLRFDPRSPSSKVHSQSSHYSAYPRFLVWKCIGILCKIHGQVLEMEHSLQNFNLYRICNGKFKSQTYATWSLLNKTKKVSQKGVSI